MQGVTANGVSPKLVMLNNTAMKVLNSSHLSSFGGLNFVIEELDRLCIGDLIEQQLPELPVQSSYTWRDILYSYWSVLFCGGDCAEDLSGNFKESLSSMPQFGLPSPDRVLKRLKDLSLPKETFTTVRGTKEHEFSFNNRLNKLNLTILNRCRPQGMGTDVLDYDNTILFTQKADAKLTYLKDTGYNPGVGLMGSNVVYFENRNGNSDAQTLQQDTLKRMFKMLEIESIPVKVFRADSATYQLSTLSVVDRNVDRFYVRARMNETLAKAIHTVKHWDEVKLGEHTVFRGETMFTPFVSTAKRNRQEHLLKQYRLVVTKEKKANGQIDLFTNEAYHYSAVVTSDFEMSKDEVVIFYNQRGRSEKEFDVLKNDFGWDHMPFSLMEQNTVYLIITAICRNIYGHIIEAFSKRFLRLRSNFRIKKFIFRFICIPAKWVRRARGEYLRIYGNIGYRT